MMVDLTRKMGCRYDGKCGCKIMLKSRAGKRDAFRIYCDYDDTCNQKILKAQKCETPTVDTTTP